MLRGLLFGRFISKSGAKLLKYIERVGMRERVIKHKNERYLYLNRRWGRGNLLLMNIKSIKYDFFFSFEYHQIAFVEIHFVTFRKMYRESNRENARQSTQVTGGYTMLVP